MTAAYLLLDSRAEWGRRILLGLPLALLLLAASSMALRLPILAAPVIGFVSLRAVRSPFAAAWAATVPVAISLGWGIGGQPTGAPGGSDCANPMSPPAVWRLVEAALVLATIALIGRAIGSTPGELGLRKSAGRLGFLSVGGFVVLALAGLLLGAWLAGPFFGSFELDVSRPAAIVPALVFALANGSMEELAYRGALLGWLGRLTEFRVALVAQALVFGVAHTGPGYVGSPLPVMAAMVAGGLLAGLIVRRTGSVVPVILLHAALDLPLYYYFACRLF
jgi:membrane protease YdiL (CAAX protease family)